MQIMALFDKLIIFALCKDLDASEIGDAIKDSIPINKTVNRIFLMCLIQINIYVLLAKIVNKMETSCKASHYYPVSSCIFLIPIYRDFRGVSQMLQEHEDKSFTFVPVKMWY